MELGGRTSTNILPGRGLINPAFVIKIVSANDDMQQPRGDNRNNPSDDFLSNLSVGDDVDGKSDDGKIISGSIQEIIKNLLGDVTYVIVTDSKGKTHRLPSTTLQIRKKFRNDTDDDEELTSSPAIFAESVLCFSEFKKNK